MSIWCIVIGMGCHTNRVVDSHRRSFVWKIDESLEQEVAAIRFHFPPPQDAYAGEVRRVQGMLHLDEDFRLAPEGGWFRVEVKDVALGEPDLDENVRNNVEFLAGKQFPISTFHLREITPKRHRFIRGRVAEVILHGDFMLRDVTIPLSAPATLEVVSDPGGCPVLFLCGSFVLEELRQNFGITGPGTEDNPAGNRLLFDFRFRLIRHSCSP